MHTSIKSSASVLGIATFVVMSLILLMYSLINFQPVVLAESSSAALPKFQQEVVDESVIVTIIKPIKEEVAEQPLVPEPIVSIVEPDIATLPAEPFDHRIIDGDRFQPANSGYLPLFMAPPKYPVSAIQRGLCGWVELKFDIGKTGETRNARVTASSSSVFEKSALQAALKYKYRPQTLNGTPVDALGVPIRIVFELEEGCG